MEQENDSNEEAQTNHNIVASSSPRNDLKWRFNVTAKPNAIFRASQDSFIIRSLINKKRRELRKFLVASNNSLSLPQAVSELNRSVMSLDKLSRKYRKRRQTRPYFLKPKIKPYPGNNNTLVDKITASKSHNIDAYSASLQHTNRLLNLRYGFQTRYVPAHSPVLVDVDIMRALQKKLGQEFAVTSRNRVRCKEDVQYQFSYYYFVKHERLYRDVGEIFDEFDTDSSSTWSDREIRTVLTKLYELPLSYTIVDHFESLLANCSKNGYEEQSPVTPEYERYIDSKLVLLAFQIVISAI